MAVRVLSRMVRRYPAVDRAGFPALFHQSWIADLATRRAGGKCPATSWAMPSKVRRSIRARMKACSSGSFGIFGARPDLCSRRCSVTGTSQGGSCDSRSCRAVSRSDSRVDSRRVNMPLNTLISASATSISRSGPVMGSVSIYGFGTGFRAGVTVMSTVPIQRRFGPAGGVDLLSQQITRVPCATWSPRPGHAMPVTACSANPSPVASW